MRVQQLILMTGIVAWLGVLGCDTDNLTDNRELSLAEQFFPLAVGNFWTYEDSTQGIPWTVSVIGDTAIKSRTYTIVQNLTPLLGLDPGLVRIENNIIYSYANGEDFILYDFTEAPEYPITVPPFFERTPSAPLLAKGRPVFTETEVQFVFQIQLTDAAGWRETWRRHAGRIQIKFIEGHTAGPRTNLIIVDSKVEQR